MNHLVQWVQETLANGPFTGVTAILPVELAYSVHIDCVLKIVWHPNAKHKSKQIGAHVVLAFGHRAWGSIELVALGLGCHRQVLTCDNHVACTTEEPSPPALPQELQCREPWT